MGQALNVKKKERTIKTPDFLNDANQEAGESGNKPFFENPAEYLYTLAQPDGKDFFKDINKDVTTTNLDKVEMDIFLLANSIIGDCINLKCENASVAFYREISALVNITKSKDGFLLKQMLKQEVTKNVNYAMDKDVKKQVKG